MLPLILLAIVAIFGGLADASQCACATSNVHLREGPGTSYDVITTLTSQQCLPHDGQRQDAGAYTWLHLNYNGQSVWAASNWLTVRSCPADNSQQPSSDVQLPGCPRIITRAEWGARPPADHIGDMPGLPVYVFIHHGASRPCNDQQSCMSTVRGYQNWHMDGNEWSDIGYNFVVGEDGNAYEGRGWNKIGAHTRGYNTEGIAVCFIGNFSDHVPNKAAQASARQLIQCGLDNHKISHLYTLKGHSDVGSTTCPGDSLYQAIQGWPHYVSGSDRYEQQQVIC